MQGPIRVVVVEADPREAAAKVKVLESEGLPLDIEAKSSLDDAAKLLEYLPPDVLLVEVASDLDEMDVTEFLHQMEDRRIHTAVVVIGDNDSDRAVRLCEVGAQDFIFKGHTTNGALARTVAIAAGRKQHSTRMMKLDPALMSRAGIDRLEQMSKEADEGDTAVESS